MIFVENPQSIVSIVKHMGHLKVTGRLSFVMFDSYEVLHDILSFLLTQKVVVHHCMQHAHPLINSISASPPSPHSCGRLSLFYNIKIVVYIFHLIRPLPIPKICLKLYHCLQIILKKLVCTLPSMLEASPILFIRPSQDEH